MLRAIRAKLTHQILAVSLEARNLCSLTLFKPLADTRAKKKSGCYRERKPHSSLLSYCSNGDVILNHIIHSLLQQLARSADRAAIVIDTMEG